jgi:hypothetical protein
MGLVAKRLASLPWSIGQRIPEGRTRGIVQVEIMHLVEWLTKNEGGAGEDG